MHFSGLLPTLLVLTTTSLSLAVAEPHPNPYHALVNERSYLARRYADPRDLIGGLVAEMGAEILQNTHPRYKACMNSDGEFAKRDADYAGFERRDAKGGGGKGGSKKGRKKSGNAFACAQYLRG
ncbi:hypothetical protein MMC17_007107 [Xylographa soralifera]|nr:hypothetical protein [Xylographa soralifera]